MKTKLGFGPNSIRILEDYAKRNDLNLSIAYSRNAWSIRIFRDYKCRVLLIGEDFDKLTIDAIEMAVAGNFSEVISGKKC